MQFTKFPKMENLQVAMEAKTEDFVAASERPTYWVVTEKVDGTNISLNITRDDFSFGCRNGLAGDDFYNVGQSYPDIAPIVDAVRRYMLIEDPDPWLEKAVQVSLYGEFFGQKIMNRLHYGNKSRFLFYALRQYYENGEARWSQWSTFNKTMCSILGAENFIVPVLATCKTFKEACEYPNDGKSHLCDDTMEGVVLWPVHFTPFHDGHVYAFKNKNEAFCETTARKVHTPLTEAQQYAKEMNSVFQQYLTESRMWSVFSKLGKADDDKRAGEYIVALLNDAWEDFANDNPDVEMLDKAGIKVVRNGGSIPYTLFKTVQAKMAKGDNA